MNVSNLFTTYESVYNNNHQPTTKKEKSLDRFWKFLLLMADKYYNGKTTTGSIITTSNDWFTDDTADMADPRINKNKTLQDILGETGLDDYVEVTSDYRTKPVGRAGYNSWHMTRNEYGKPNAYDIVPKSGYTFEDLRDKLLNNETFLSWANDNGFNINDETSPAVLRRTGGTGAHFHIGPDKFAVIKKHRLGGGISKKDRELSEKINQMFNETYQNSAELTDRLLSQQNESIINNQLIAENHSLDQNWFQVSDDHKNEEFHLAVLPDDYISLFPNHKQEFSPDTKKYKQFDRWFLKYGTNPIFLNYKGFWYVLADKESGYNPNAKSSGGYFRGLFQKGNGTLGNVRKQFKEAAEWMNGMLAELKPKHWRAARKMGLTKTGVMAALWLHGGPRVRAWLLAPEDEKDEYDLKDGNGVKISDYAKRFSSDYYE